MSVCVARRHGTVSAYTKFGCRCETARAKKRLAEKLYRMGIAPARVVDNTGTRRRIQALMAIGWPFKTIAQRLGYSDTSSPWRLVTQTKVHIDTARKVAALYDELSMTPGPSAASRKAAARSGYLPPLAWDDDRIDDPTYQPTQPDHDQTIDEVAVRRVLAGDRPIGLRRDELVAAVLTAHTQGLSDAEIGERLGLRTNTVYAMRTRARRAVGVSGRSGTPSRSDGQPGQGLEATG